MTEIWPAAYRIETPRLVLRCFDLCDAPGAHAVLGRNQAELAPWLDLGDDVAPIDAMAARMKEFRGAFDRGERFHYAAFVPGRSELAGTIAVEPIGGRGLLAGGWIDPALASSGFATEALAAVCRIGLELGGARFVELRIRVDNAPSRVLAERLGFVHEATLAGRALVGDTAIDEMIWTLPRAASAAADLTVRALDVLGRPLN